MNPLITRLYWQITALLLASHFAGWHHGLILTLSLNVLQALHFFAVRRRWRALDVQVRWLYLTLLLLGLWPPLAWLHVAQFGGLIALLVADYCLAARMLVLLPWNRPVPFNAALLRWVLLSPPAPGSMAERLARESQPDVSSNFNRCTLPEGPRGSSATKRKTLGVL